MEAFDYTVATREDIPDIIELWQLCFNDPQEWVDWYFGSPFDELFFLLCRDRGRLISMAHLRRYETRVRGVVLPSCAYCGFATHPDYRGRHILTDLIVRLSHQAHEWGCVVGFHSPNKITRHYPVLHFECADICSFENADPLSPLPLYDGSQFDGLYACYREFAQAYSCMVERSNATMRLRLEDFLSDGGEISYCEEDGKITGYALSHGFNAEEIVYTTQTALSRIKAAMRGGVLPFGNERLPFSVMNAIDVRELLRRVGADVPVTFEIEDDVLPWNAGVYDGRGSITHKKPDVTLNSGRLMQLTNGYHSAYELHDAGLLSVQNADVLAVLDAAFPKLDCYVFEKY